MKKGRIRVEKRIEEEGYDRFIGEEYFVYRGINDFAFGSDGVEIFLNTEELEEIPPDYLGANYVDRYWFVRADRVAESVYKKMKGETEDRIFHALIKKLKEVTLHEILEYSGWEPRRYIRTILKDLSKKEKIEKIINSCLAKYPGLEREEDKIKMKTSDSLTYEGLGELCFRLSLYELRCDVKYGEIEEDKGFVRSLED